MWYCDLKCLDINENVLNNKNTNEICRLIGNSLREYVFRISRTLIAWS